MERPLKIAGLLCAVAVGVAVFGSPSAAAAMIDRVGEDGTVHAASGRGVGMAFGLSNVDHVASFGRSNRNKAGPFAQFDADAFIGSSTSDDFDYPGIWNPSPQDLRQLMGLGQGQSQGIGLGGPPPGVPPEQVPPIKVPPVQVPPDRRPPVEVFEPSTLGLLGAGLLGIGVLRRRRDRA